MFNEQCSFSRIHTNARLPSDIKIRDVMAHSREHLTERLECVRMRLCECMHYYIIELLFGGDKMNLLHYQMMMQDHILTRVYVCAGKHFHLQIPVRKLKSSK